MERSTGFEPVPGPWQGPVLPLYYDRFNQTLAWGLKLDKTLRGHITPENGNTITHAMIEKKEILKPREPAS
jgi:hypothetical protein